MYRSDLLLDVMNEISYGLSGKNNFASLALLEIKIYTLRGTSNATLKFLDITQKSFN